MRTHRRQLQAKRHNLIILIAIALALASVTPVLADYLGPARTVTEQKSVCKIVLNACQYVAAKDDFRYHQVNSWSCSNEDKPWKDYPNNAPPCTSDNTGDKYWERDESLEDVIVTYPPATISSALQNCSQSNGWCTGPAQLALTGSEPVAGYRILAVEGTRNGQNFACPGATCTVPLAEGNNSFTFWALSSFADTSAMGTLTAKVDSKDPVITGTLKGTLGSNNWYTSTITFNGSASDATTGVAKFTCTLDGTALPSCSVVNIDEEGPHTLILTAQDNVGHTDVLSLNASVDTQAPSLNVFLTGTQNSDTGWYTAATLTGSASDASPGSGLSTFKYNLDNSGWVHFPASGELSLPEGKHSLSIRAIDKAGLTALTTKSYWLDSELPTIAINPVGTLGTNDWYTSDLSLTASASDSISGLDVFEYSLNDNPWTPYTTPLLLSNGSHSITFWAGDEAGLTAQAIQTYRVDTQAPQIAGSLSGETGENGWFTSDVILSASASDPLPGSGIDTFTYTQDGSPAAPYTDALTLADGKHTILLSAQDKAGLSSTNEQTVQVDTTLPLLNIQTTLPEWIKGDITLDGTAGDDGSGLSKVEISMDGGQTWQLMDNSASWSYAWNTTGSTDGPYEIAVRATDNAGLANKQTLKTGVDHAAPEISLPDFWYQWDTVTLDIWDDYSGLAEARVEITDPKGRWPTRVISLDPSKFPVPFKWDRRFDGDVVAPAGKYEVKVIAVDNLGNSTSKNASTKVLIDILPPGPTATLPSTTRPSPTPTFSTTATSTHVNTGNTPTKAVVKVFGSTPLPQIPASPTPGATSTPRATATQSTVKDLLESVFVPKSNPVENTTEIRSPQVTAPESQAGSEASVLWGAAAAAMIGSMTAYAIEEKRKQEEEKAKRLKEEAEEAERRAKKRARKMEKLEAQWAQERAWEEARLEQERLEREKLMAIYKERGDELLLRQEAEEAAKWVAAQQAIRDKYEAKKREEEEKQKAEELQAGLAAYYNGMKQGEEAARTEQKENSKAEKVWSWFDNHQQEVALAIGIGVGVVAILASGGLAIPAVAAAWTVGAAAVAAGAAAAGTIALNNHYDRKWNENLLKNVTYAGVAAAAVTGGWFLLQAASAGVGAFCAANQTTCTRVDPILNAIDTGEELSLGAKLAIQTWRGDQAGAAETALEIQTEKMDGGMPGNWVAKKLGGETLQKVAAYGDDAINLALKHGDDAAQIILKYGYEGVEVLQRYGSQPADILKAIELINSYEDYAVKILNVVEPAKANNLLKTLDDDVMDYVLQEGPDAVDAMARWSATDLAQHGPQLALRAKKDAKVLADVEKLVKLKPIDPKNPTKEQQALIDAIAANSTFYSDEGQVVLGKWVDMGSGFVQHAQDTGSVHYNPHPDLWNTLGELGKGNQDDVAWLVNQKVVQSGIDKGLPFEFSLNGIAEKDLDIEQEAVESIFENATDTEIMNIFGGKKLPIRIKELQELHEAGYKYSYDELTNSYIFSLP